MGIGLVLLLSSLLLARETKGLLIGESADQRVRDAILRIAREDPDVRTANGVLTLQMGVNQVVAALSVEFHDALNTTQIEACVNPHRGGDQARATGHYNSVRQAAERRNVATPDRAIGGGFRAIMSCVAPDWGSACRIAISGEPAPSSGMSFSHFRS
jgi:hypothetical protein